MSVWVFDRRPIRTHQQRAPTAKAGVANSSTPIPANDSVSSAPSGDERQYLRAVNVPLQGVPGFENVPVPPLPSNVPE